MEEYVVPNTPESKSISGVISYLLRNPVQALLVRWNWKTAFLSALMRSSIFFATYFFKKEGLAVALGAMAAQFVFRSTLGGVNGAIIQAFARVEPAWHAALLIPLTVAVFSHIIEFAVQAAYDSYAQTNSKGKAIIFSISFSVISAFYNLFIMRRGAFLVRHADQQSLGRDLKRVPWLTLQFLLFPINWLRRRGFKH